MAETAEKAAHPSVGFKTVRIILGLLLIAAAGLKLLYPSPEESSGLALLESPHWRMTAINGEAFLGFWLLTGAFPRLNWLVALFVFSLLAGLSLYFVLEGRPSCECFGSKLGVSPWYAVGLDLTAVLSLMMWRPAQIHTNIRSSEFLFQMIHVGIGAGVILAALVGMLAWMYGSPFEALDRVRGDLASIDPPMVDVGMGYGGEQKPFTIKVRNLTRGSIRIIGGTSNCSCLTTENLPIRLERGEVASLKIVVRYPNSPGAFERAYTLQINNELNNEQVSVLGRLQAKAIPKPSNVE